MEITTFYPMKKLIFILAIILSGCSEKLDNHPIQIQSVEKGENYINVTFEVRREVNLSVRPYGLMPYYQHYKKGVYGYIGENKLTIFDYEFGKLIVE